MVKRIKCPQCNGKGTVVCYHCGGKDKRFNERTGKYEKVKCLPCGNTRRMKCLRCDGQGYIYKED